MIAEKSTFNLARRLGNRIDGLSKRHAGLEIEGQSDRRKLTLVRHRQRTRLGLVSTSTRRSGALLPR